MPRMTGKAVLQLSTVPLKQQSTDALLAPPSQKERCSQLYPAILCADSPSYSLLLASTKRDIPVLFNMGNGPESNPLHC